MKASLKSQLDRAMSDFLDKTDSHQDRPDGLACDNLADMMAEAAAQVYDASHAGAMAEKRDNEN